MFSAGCCLRLQGAAYDWAVHLSCAPVAGVYVDSITHTTRAATYDQTVLTHTKSRFQLHAEDFYHCQYHFEVVLKYYQNIYPLITTWRKGAGRLAGGPAGSLGIIW